ncbi:holo-ACP synthase [Mycoplasmoides pneumoniae]|uniref:Holo-[acyl-carrier-protein] synthase n=4 Tax=Mycoplasmoides pneumoniae TaxID=2104 RepID=ACPS_MYCPN|nr:holo-ACP synthase [Mycoplasmoides pneumoniae]P75480.1 RecName: Full=Holo-[acyl-carrier-protein] synthase; Short=Holo-ACP synthase; AltName: Full=4'-phosphopantetheinyl transferase AcpS [Mycoplasmoides pneumoniae M129]AAB96186.1 holo-acyl-carrier protein synthase-like protein [Mycoplasmoides pneumoniae M129]ADK87072.1 putative holo-[acyl-carrier-protein] synthase [Mycoplasmoides pneumoniae FH]AGC04220.1 4'-phosphopantetheinyl transferase [Mycoplasmoides pneumoniae M129-B7]ALA30181.1 4'-phosp
MILGIGIDLVEIKRFEQLARQTDNCFAKRLLTSTEYAHYAKLRKDSEKSSFLAVHWSLKEAIYKAVNHIKPLFSQLEITKKNQRYNCQIDPKIELLLSVSYSSNNITAICLAQQTPWKN